MGLSSVPLSSRLTLSGLLLHLLCPVPQILNLHQYVTTHTFRFYYLFVDLAVAMLSGIFIKRPSLHASIFLTPPRDGRTTYRGETRWTRGMLTTRRRRRGPSFLVAVSDCVCVGRRGGKGGGGQMRLGRPPHQMQRRGGGCCRCRILITFLFMD